MGNITNQNGCSHCQYNWEAIWDCGTSAWTVTQLSAACNSCTAGTDTDWVVDPSNPCRFTKTTFEGGCCGDADCTGGTTPTAPAGGAPSGCCGVDCNSCDPPLASTYSITLTFVPPIPDIPQTVTGTVTYFGGCEWHGVLSNGVTSINDVILTWNSFGYWEIESTTLLILTECNAIGPTTPCNPVGHYHCDDPDGFGLSQDADVS